MEGGSTEGAHHAAVSGCCQRKSQLSAAPARLIAMHQRVTRPSPAWRVSAALFVLVLLPGAFTSVACGGRRTEMTRIRLAVARSPFTYLPVYLAGPLGYYKDEGLTVEI